MKEETKKYLIIGGGLVIAIVVGIVVYKKYEANAGASQAAQDQATQDELAYLQSQGMDNAYASAGGGTGGFTIAAPSSPTGTSLAQELQAIEQAFGFGPPASPASSPASLSSAPSGGAPAPSGSGAPKVKSPILPVPPRERSPVTWHGIMDEMHTEFQREGVAVA